MPTIEQMYNGIYGPANQSIAPMAPTPPSPPSPPRAPAGASIADMYRGIYGPNNYASPVGDAFSRDDVLRMLSGPQRTQIVPGLVNSPNEYAIDKGPQERLLGGVLPRDPTGGVGRPPTTRTVPSVPYNPAPATANVPLPRPRPTTLADLFAMPTPVSQRPPSVNPLRVTVNGAASYRAPAVPVARPVARPAPAPAPKPVATVPRPLTASEQRWASQSKTYSGGPVSAATGFGSDRSDPYSRSTSISG